MYIYRMHRDEWEQYLLRPRHATKAAAGGPEADEEDIEDGDDDDDDQDEDAEHSDSGEENSVKVESVVTVTVDEKGSNCKQRDAASTRNMKATARPSSVAGNKQATFTKKPAITGLAALLTDKKTDKFGSKMRSFADVDREKAQRKIKKQ